MRNWKQKAQWIVEIQHYSKWWIRFFISGEEVWKKHVLHFSYLENSKKELRWIRTWQLELFHFFRTTHSFYVILEMFPTINSEIFIFHLMLKFSQNMVLFSHLIVKLFLDTRVYICHFLKWCSIEELCWKQK